MRFIHLGICAQLHTVCRSSTESGLDRERTPPRDPTKEGTESARSIPPPLKRSAQPFVHKRFKIPIGLPSSLPLFDSFRRDMDDLLQPPMQEAGNLLPDLVRDWNQNKKNVALITKTFEELRRIIQRRVSTTTLFTEFSVLSLDPVQSAGPVMTEKEKNALIRLISSIDMLLGRLPVQYANTRFGKDYYEIFRLYNHLYTLLTVDDPKFPRMEFAPQTEVLAKINMSVSMNNLKDLVAVYWWFFNSRFSELKFADTLQSVSINALKKLYSLCETNKKTSHYFPQLLNDLIVNVFSQEKESNSKGLFLQMIQMFDSVQSMWREEASLTPSGEFRPGTFEPLYYLRHVSSLASAGKPTQYALLAIVENKVTVKVATHDRDEVTIMRIRHAPVATANLSSDQPTIDWPREALDWILSVRYKSDNSIDKRMIDRFERSLMQVYWNELDLEDEIVRVTRWNLIDYRRDLMGKLVQIFLRLTRKEADIVADVVDYASQVESTLFIHATESANVCRGDEDHWTKHTTFADYQDQFDSIDELYKKYFGKKVSEASGPEEKEADAV